MPMNQALVQDVVSEVMKRLGDRRPGTYGPSKPIGAGGNRGGVRAGEDAPANEPERKATYAHPHRTNVPVGQFGIFNDVDDAVTAATEAQKKLVKLTLDERDQIVKLVKSMAKSNAQAWGKLELDETKIGRLDHKIEKLQILELVPGVELLKKIGRA